MAGLEIYLFGTPRIYLNQQPLDVDTRKAIALMAYLAVANAPVNRAQIIELLWADYDETRSRSSLRRTLSVLRKALDRSWLMVEDETLALRQSEELLVDVRAFRQPLKELKKRHHTITEADIEAIEKAIALYNADFLLGFNLRDSSPFEEWSLTEAQRLQHELLDALAVLVEWYIVHRDYSAVVRVAERWQQLNPYEDKPIFYLLQAHTQLGNRSRAIQIFESFEALLRKEMEIQPLPETQALYMQLVDGDTLPETAFYVAPTQPVIIKLPPLLKPFVGREKELQRLTTRLLDDRSRLMSIVGMGGIGKTTLALQLAHQSKHLFHYGLFYVSLENSTDDTTLISQIAAVLDLQFHDRDSTHEQLLSFLKPKAVLLLLDNFEHYEGEHQLLLDLIYQTTAAQLVIISQHPLNLQEEWRFQLKGLALPTSTAPQDIQQAAAFRLLVTSIQRLHWSFEPTSNIQALADLCTFLDGMPLALELAAVHIEQASNSIALLADLKERIDVLVTTYANVPERHRSLYAIFDYSWQHLEPAQQHLLLCLTVFVGSFDEAAVVSITGHVIGTLHQLQQVAMVTEVDQGRVAIPGPLLTYLRQHDFSSSTAVLVKHSHYYAGLVESLNLDGPDQINALKHVERDLSNIVLGCTVAARQHQYQRLDQYVDALFLFYEIRGRYQEGADLFESLIEHLQVVQPLSPTVFHVYGRVISRLGVFNRHLGNIAIAIEQLEVALGIQENISDWPSLTWTLNQLGIGELMRGNREQAERLITQSLTMAEGLPDNLQVAKASANLGIIAIRRHDYAAAEQYQRRSHAIYQKLGHLRLMAYTLNNLGNIYFSQEKYDRAVFHYLKSAEQKEELGDRWGVVCSLINLGRVELSRHAPENALETFHKCLDICQDLGKRSGIAQAHDHLAQAYSAIGDQPASIVHFAQAAQAELALGNFGRLGSILGTLAESFMRHENIDVVLLIWTTIAHDERFLAADRDTAKAALRDHQHRPTTILPIQELLITLASQSISSAH